MIKTLLSGLMISIACAVNAQTYNPIKTAWQHAGYSGTKPAFPKTINITDYGADNTGVDAADAALASAITALNSAPGTISFPAGTFLFNKPIGIYRDSIAFSGSGYDATTLCFKLDDHVSNLINIIGSQGVDTALLAADALRGSTAVAVENAAHFHSGDWITVGMDDADYMSSSWAYGSLAQTLQIQRISGDTVFVSSPLRACFLRTKHALIRRIIPKNNIGFECLKIKRLDATVGQSSNIVFDGAVNCWIKGIESDSANFAHVEIDHSSNIEVSNSYFHDAFAYGGNGQGYGILMQFGSGECKIEANYFNHLRHSMVLQAGANGNVLAYNYSTHPYWTEPGLPDSSAGEIVLHGNYPFMNLAEGNMVNNIVIDDSHGRNGPLNTFFRNRASGYGIFMNFNPATDSMQFIGNEITNASTGLYFISGSGHFLYGNNYRGSITSGAANVPDTSLYLLDAAKLVCSGSYKNWVAFGQAGTYNRGSIYARDRAIAGHPASCSCPGVTTTGIAAVAGSNGYFAYPNPAGDYFQINGVKSDYSVELYDINGQQVLTQNSNHPGQRFSVQSYPAGNYLLRIITETQSMTQPLLIAN